MFGKYILKGTEPAPCADALQWARAFETMNRRVGDVEIDGVRVSTVFLGIDHNFGEGGGPILFETMVFGGREDGEQWRYRTWAEALAGHNKVCARVFGTRARRARATRQAVPLPDDARRIIRE